MFGGGRAGAEGAEELLAKEFRTVPAVPLCIILLLCKIVVEDINTRTLKNKEANATTGRTAPRRASLYETAERKARSRLLLDEQAHAVDTVYPVGAGRTQRDGVCLPPASGAERSLVKSFKPKVPNHGQAGDRMARVVINSRVWRDASGRFGSVIRRHAASDSAPSDRVHGPIGATRRAVRISRRSAHLACLLAPGWVCAGLEVGSGHQQQQQQQQQQPSQAWRETRRDENEPFPSRVVGGELHSGASIFRHPARRLLGVALVSPGRTHSATSLER